MNPVTQAARSAIDMLINDSPTMLTVMRKPEIDGGMGQNVVFGELRAAGEYRCRIGRDPGRLQKAGATEAGMMTNSDFLVTAPWFADIRIDDILQEPDGKQWRVGPVEKSKASGEVFAVKATLEEVE